MKRLILAAMITLLAGCVGAPAPGHTSRLTELETQVAALQAETKLARLELADERERADVQLYLTRQEVAAAKREASTLKAKCGAACAQ
jgi:hypothetical protein